MSIRLSTHGTHFLYSYFGKCLSFSFVSTFAFVIYPQWTMLQIILFGYGKFSKFFSNVIDSRPFIGCSKTCLTRFIVFLCPPKPTPSSIISLASAFRANSGPPRVIILCIHTIIIPKPFAKSIHFIGGYFPQMHKAPSPSLLYLQEIYFLGCYEVITPLTFAQDRCVIRRRSYHL